MIRVGKWQTVELSLCLAVMMHLLLFLGVRSPAPDGLRGVRVPPDTRYLGTASAGPGLNAGDARKVWSPVLFSLPSSMGFSRTLLHERPKLSQTLSGPQIDTEPFLEVSYLSTETGLQLNPTELMLTGGATPAPPLPRVIDAAASKPVAPRVYVDPGLKDRLEGGIVLPIALNQAVRVPWEIRADISVSSDGLVKHVLLEEPLKSANLNQEVIRLLYSLHFKSADRPSDGYIEIYSLEVSDTDEVVP